MPLAAHTTIPDKVLNEDLARIDQPIARQLVGELLELRFRPMDECPELTCQWDEVSHRRADIGNFVIVFYLRPGDGGMVAVVECVIHKSELSDWLEAQIEQAEKWTPEDSGPESRDR